MFNNKYRVCVPLGITMPYCKYFKYNDLAKPPKNDDVNDDVNCQKFCFPLLSILFDFIPLNFFSDIFLHIKLKFVLLIYVKLFRENLWIYPYTMYLLQQWKTI